MKILLGLEWAIEQGTTLITNVRRNMKNRLIPLVDKLLLRKRSVIETVNDQLKNMCDIEHSRSRNPINFMVNMVAGLIRYSVMSETCNHPKISNPNSTLLINKPITIS